MKFENEINYFIFFSNGKWTERLCPDGMVFNDYSSDQEKCDLPYNLDCSKRPKLREFMLMHKYTILINIYCKWFCKRFNIACPQVTPNNDRGHLTVCGRSIRDSYATNYNSVTHWNSYVPNNDVLASRVSSVLNKYLQIFCIYGIRVIALWLPSEKPAGATIMIIYYCWESTHTHTHAHRALSHKINMQLIPVLMHQQI